MAMTLEIFQHGFTYIEIKENIFNEQSERKGKKEIEISVELSEGLMLMPSRWTLKNIKYSIPTEPKLNQTRATRFQP